jgi:methylmalonyl-CoA mutase C-terminal domain/subunit
MVMTRKIRVLMFKPGIDGHWRGIMTASKALPEVGMETIFAGFRNIEDVVEAAIQEDVDVIGYSCHSGAHLEWTRELVDCLERKGAKDEFLLLMGGVIPMEDKEELLRTGVHGVFGPAWRTEDIVAFIINRVNQQREL